MIKHSILIFLLVYLCPLQPIRIQFRFKESSLNLTIGVLKLRIESQFRQQFGTLKIMSAFLNQGMRMIKFDTMEITRLHNPFLKLINSIIYSFIPSKRGSTILIYSLFIIIYIFCNHVSFCHCLKYCRSQLISLLFHHNN